MEHRSHGFGTVALHHPTTHVHTQTHTHPRVGPHKQRVFPFPPSGGGEPGSNRDIAAADSYRTSADGMPLPSRVRPTSQAFPCAGSLLEIRDRLLFLRMLISFLLVLIVGAQQQQPESK